MRLIDADELRKQWSADDACEHDYTHLHFLESIDSAPTIKQWIPVIDRLPEEDGYYLVTKISCDGKRVTSVYAVYFSVEYKDWETLDDVIAWMPLMKQYEGSEEE